MDTLTSYSKFYMNLDKSNPFEIRRFLDDKFNKIKNLDSKSMQKREFTLLKKQKQLEEIKKIFTINPGQEKIENKTSYNSFNYKQNELKLKSNSQKDKYINYYSQNQSSEFERNLNKVGPSIQNINNNLNQRYLVENKKEKNLSQIKNKNYDREINNFSKSAYEFKNFYKKQSDESNKNALKDKEVYDVSNNILMMQHKNSDLPEEFLQEEIYFDNNKPDNNLGNKNYSKTAFNFNNMNTHKQSSLSKYRESANKHQRTKGNFPTINQEKNMKNSVSPLKKTKGDESFEENEENIKSNDPPISKNRDIRINTNNTNHYSKNNKNINNFSKSITSLKKLDLENLLSQPIKEENDVRSKIPEYLFCLISEEDRIFDEYGQKYKEMHKGLELFKSLTKKKNKINIQMDPIQKLLAKVYKADKNLLYNLKVAKKQKNLDLENYQKNLINTIGKVLTKESITKLTNNLKNLKFNAYSVCNFENKEFIKEFEEKELEIINNLQKREEQLEKLRVVGRIHQVQPIPTIRFKKISKD